MTLPMLPNLPREGLGGGASLRRATAVTSLRRARPELYDSGDVCVFSGDEIAHEVGKVCGTVPRVTMLVSLQCRSS